MTNMLRNKESPASTWFGGTVCRPRALRVSERTTKILVKLVIISSSDGATEMTVSSSRMVIDVLGLVLPPTSMVVGPVGDFGPAGAAGVAATARGAAATARG